MTGDDREMGKEITEDGHWWTDITIDDAKMGVDDPRWLFINFLLEKVARDDLGMGTEY